LFMAATLPTCLHATCPDGAQDTRLPWCTQREMLPVGPVTREQANLRRVRRLPLQVGGALLTAGVVGLTWAALRPEAPRVQLAAIFGHGFASAPELAIFPLQVSFAVLWALVFAARFLLAALQLEQVAGRCCRTSHVSHVEIGLDGTIDVVASAGAAKGDMLILAQSDLYGALCVALDVRALEHARGHDLVSIGRLVPPHDSDL
jgi:hypothetical protein